MAKPTLTVIAGCNGSGKSSYSHAITENSIPYDYDKVYLEKYNGLIDNELRDVMAHNIARADFENQIDSAISDGKNFSYETNFNSTPLYWPTIFKEADYHLRLIYFCLDSIEEAKKRVQIRVENGGHFVPENEIITRYNLGFQHLDEHWAYFDEVHLFETSTYKAPPKHFLSLLGESMLFVIGDLPAYLEDLIPSIMNRTP